MVVDFCAGFLRNFDFGKTFTTQVWHIAYYLLSSKHWYRSVREVTAEKFYRVSTFVTSQHCFPLYTSATRLDYYSSLKYNMDILRGEQWAYESADFILRVCILAKRSSLKEKSPNEVSSSLEVRSCLEWVKRTFLVVGQELWNAHFLVWPVIVPAKILTKHPTESAWKQLDII